MTTPYWGILKELAVWPMRQNIEYHKVMLYHQLMHSEDKRIAKWVIKDQQVRGQEKCWYQDVKEIADRMEINIDEIGRISKSQRKKIVKT